MAGDDAPVVPAEECDPALERRRVVRGRLRLAALALFFVGSLILAKVTGLSERVDVETVRTSMESAGAFGFVLFILIFAIGELLHVPGMVFVGAASVVYGEVVGIVVGYVGALVSVMVSFVVVRAIGGQPLGSVKRPFVVRMLSHLDTNPVRTVTLLRLVFWLTPGLNYALAMSKVRARDFFFGSALGLLLPITLVVLAFDWIVTLPFFQ